MQLSSSALPTTEKKKGTILAVFCLLFCIVLALVLNRSSQIRYQSDLFARWYAAKQLFTEGRDLYDAANGQEVVAYKSTPTTPLEAGFYYPAYLAVLLWPITWMPFQFAHLLWTIALQLMYVGGIWLIACSTGWPGSLNRLTVWMIGCLVFIPFLQNAIWSQFDTIGVLFLALSYAALQKERYFWAGLSAGGLLFKPQAGMAALGFLLMWSLFVKKRWPLLGGFLLAGAVLWGSAEAVQPGWVGGFIRSLGEYQQLPYQVNSVLDKLWNPGHTLSILLMLAMVVLWVYLRKEAAGSPLFRLGLAASLCAGWLSVPVIGMLHLVLLPLAAILVFSALRELSSKWERLAVWGLLGLYLFSWVGFIYGLSRPELYGLHIELAEAALKVLAPLFFLSICIYSLFFIRKTERAHA